MRPAGIVQAACAAAAYAALGWVGSRPESWKALEGRPFILAGAVLLATLIFLGLAVLTIAGLALARIGPWAEALAAVVCGGLWWAARKSGLPLLTDVLLILGAGLFGCLVSRIVREKAILLPVALTAVLVDTWGVYFGFVSDVSRHQPQVVSQLSAPLPVAAKALSAVPVLGSIGVGDFAFLGLFLAATARLGLQWRGTLAWVLGLLLVGPTAIMGISAAFGYQLDVLPGLFFLAVALVAANRRHFALKRPEWFALLYTVLVVLSVIGLYTLTRVLLRRGT